MSEGHIWIDEQITNDTYEKVKKDIAFHSSANALVLHIASPGGSVYSGYKIFHALKNSGKQIQVLIEGEAQSMASYLAILGTSKICNPSRFMIHNPRTGIDGVVTSKDMIQGANELIKIEDEMAQGYSQKTGIAVETIKEMMAKETILTAQEAKDLGFVDEIITDHFLKAVAVGKKQDDMAPVRKVVARAMALSTLN